MYTKHIKKLNIAQWPPKALFKKIKTNLRATLKKRDLWNAPPEWLGYPEFRSWEDEGALDALAFDCYQFAIVSRIRSLRNQLKIKDNVDGIIRRNIRNFLTAQQEKYDPYGYAVGKNVSTVVQKLIDEQPNIIRAQNLQKGKLCNQTVLMFSPANPTIHADQNFLWDSIRCETDWLNLRFEMLRISEKSQEKFSEIISQLANTNIFSFLYKDLITCLKDDARAAGKASNVALELDDIVENFEVNDYLPQIVKMTQPETTYEEWESCQKLVKECSLKILGLNHPHKERIYAVFLEWANSLDLDEPQPTQAEIARRLNLARQTVSDYIKIIRNLWPEKN